MLPYLNDCFNIKILLYYILKGYSLLTLSPRLIFHYKLYHVYNFIVYKYGIEPVNQLLYIIYYIHVLAFVLTI